MIALLLAGVALLTVVIFVCEVVAPMLAPEEEKRARRRIVH